MFLDEKTYMTKTGFDELGKELTNNDSKVRTQAAQALGTLGPKAAAQGPALAQAVADKEQEVQLAAISALPRVTGAGSIPLLTKILKDEKESLTVRLQVIHSMPALGDKGKPCVDELAVLLVNKDPDLVAAAINSLAAFGDVASSAIPALKNFDPKQLSFEGVTKDANKNVLEEVNRTREAIKTSAEEAIKQISEAKPKPDIKPKK
jgi:HEAT repeat protein